MAPEARVSVIKFSASWCGPCHRCAPDFHRLKEETASKNVMFFEVDVDKDNLSTERYNVTSLPTFVLLQNDREVKRIVGADMDSVRRELFGLLERTFATLPASSGKDSSGKDSSGKEIPSGVQNAPPLCTQ